MIECPGMRFRRRGTVGEEGGCMGRPAARESKHVRASVLAVAGLPTGDLLPGHLSLGQHRESYVTHQLTDVAMQMRRPA